MISGKDNLEVTSALNLKKAELHFHGEVKWTKVTGNYLSKYMELMTLFFSFVKSGKIKVRIMFRNNADEPSEPSVSPALRILLFRREVKPCIFTK